MKSLIAIVVCLSVVGSFAIDRLGSPIAASRWDEALPEAAHPAFSAGLGSLQEGRVSLGIMQSDLGHLSLTLPGFQVISANTRWKKNGDSLPYKYTPKQKALFFDSLGNPLVRYRGYFSVAGGVNMSSIMEVPKDWDLGIGFQMENQQLFDASEDHQLWTRRDVGGSVEIRWKQLTGAGSWSPRECRYRAGWEVPMDYQLGLVVYQNLQVSNAFGFQLAGEKIFHESFRVRSGYQQQFVEKQNVEKFLLIGFSLRFRPWRPGVDPEWTKNLVSPLGGPETVGRYLYDWEISTNLNVGLLNSGADAVFTISRWF